MTNSQHHNGWVPTACTLPTIERPIRVTEFDQFFAAFGRAMRRTDRTRAEVVVDPGAEALAQALAEREAGCCSFFDFGFTTDAEGLVMTVGVPSAYSKVLDAFVARIESAIGSGR